MNERCKEGTDGSFHCADLQKMFPELKESEDERMRNAAINACKYMVDNFENSTKQYEDAISWLEKQGNLMGALQEANKKIGELVEENYYLKEQGEQKSIISDDALREGKDYFGITQHQIDNWLKKYVHVEKQGGQKPNYCHHEVDLSNCSEEYTKGYYDGWNNCNQQHAQLEAEQKPADIKTTGYWHIEDTEQNPAWSEEDEKILKAIHNSIDVECLLKNGVGYPGMVYWFESLKDRVQPQHEWKQENTGDLTDFENAMMHIGGSFFGQHAGLDPNDTNTIKEQANVLLGLVPSKEWNYNDEIIIETIIQEIEKIPSEKFIDNAKYRCLDWLRYRTKSLRPQNRWKPSDLPHWKKTTLPNDNTTGFNSDYFCHKGYCINYKELFEKLPKDD